MRIAQLVILSTLVGCSGSTNFNQFFVSKKQKEALDSLNARAEIAYDKGDFQEALKYAQKAYDANPTSEAASVLLGYIRLSLAGVDTFQLADNLIQQSDNASSSLIAETKDVSSSLGDLAGIIGFSEEELTKLTTTEVGELKGESENPIFDEESMNVVFPLSAADARANIVDNLVHLNSAIDVVCPWVEESAKILETSGRDVNDPRHLPKECPPSTTTRRFSAKAHYLWSMAHLSEAIAFNSVFSKNLTALDKRAEALNSKSSVNPADYVGGVVELAEIVAILMPTDPEESASSMLKAIFNDFKATSTGFAAIPGMPDSLSKSINSALTKLEEQSKKISQAGGDVDADAGALRDQLTKKLAEKVKQQMTEREDEFSAEEKQDACEAFGKLSTEKLDMCES
jgi:hypothetical protein